MSLDQRGRAAGAQARTEVEGSEPPNIRSLVGQRNRRRRAGWAVAAVIVAGVGWLGTSKADDDRAQLTVDGEDATAADDTKVTTAADRTVVTTGELAGNRWQLEVYDGADGRCLEMRYLRGTAGGCGFGVPPRALSFFRWGGAGQTALFGAARDDVARIVAFDADGGLFTTTPVGKDLGLGAAFYVLALDADRSISRVVAYDENHQVLDRFDIPPNADLEDLRPADPAATADDVGPSQLPEAAERDGVVPEIAAMSLEDRVVVLAAAEAPEGTWVISEPGPGASNQARDCVIGDQSGQWGQDWVCTAEYGEVLLLDDAGQIARAYPMPSVPPSWIYVADDALYGGKVGDGGLPHNAFFRIDRVSGDIIVVVLPNESESGPTSWPTFWHVLRDGPDAERFAGIIDIGPGAVGTQTTTWIGVVAVDLERLRDAFATLP